MYNNFHTSLLSFEIGMSIAIFIIALLTMVGTILRIIVSCINLAADLLILVSNCCAKGYAALISRRRHNYVRCNVN